MSWSFIRKFVKGKDKDKVRKPSKKSKEGKDKNYIFLGLPASGKTTYFTLMAYLLQRESNKTKKFRFKFLSDERNDDADESAAIPTFSPAAAKKFISASIKQIENQKWPDKTQLDARAQYRFELLKKWASLKFRMVISYFDFPGELFEALLRQDTEKSMMIGDELRARFESAFGNAEGLFLIVDAERMFNKINSEDDDVVLSRLFDILKGKKIAILFSKVDLFFGVSALEDKETLVSIFRETYPDAYARIEDSVGNCGYFPVKAFSEIDIPEDGSDPRPPQKVKYDKSLLTPVRWMFGFMLKGIEKEQ